MLAWVGREDLAWTGQAPQERRSSPLARRSFCATCGSPLTLSYDEGEAELAIHVGAFDRPGLLPPSYHYGVEGRLSWVDCGEGLPEKQTDLDPSPG